MDSDIKETGTNSQKVCSFITEKIEMVIIERGNVKKHLQRILILPVFL